MQTLSSTSSLRYQEDLLLSSEGKFKIQLYNYLNPNYFIFQISKSHLFCSIHDVFSIIELENKESSIGAVDVVFGVPIEQLRYLIALDSDGYLSIWQRKQQEVVKETLDETGGTSVGGRNEVFKFVSKSSEKLLRVYEMKLHVVEEDAAATTPAAKQSSYYITICTSKFLLFEFTTTGGSEAALIKRTEILSPSKSFATACSWVKAAPSTKGMDLLAIAWDTELGIYQMSRSGSVQTKLAHEILTGLGRITAIIPVLQTSPQRNSSSGIQWLCSSNAQTIKTYSTPIAVQEPSTAEEEEEEESIGITSLKLPSQSSSPFVGGSLIIKELAEREQDMLPMISSITSASSKPKMSLIEPVETQKKSTFSSSLVDPSSSSSLLSRFSSSSSSSLLQEHHRINSETYSEKERQQQQLGKSCVFLVSFNASSNSVVISPEVALHHIQNPNVLTAIPHPTSPHLLHICAGSRYKSNFSKEAVEGSNSALAEYILLNTSSSEKSEVQQPIVQETISAPNNKHLIGLQFLCSESEAGNNCDQQVRLLVLSGDSPTAATRTNSSMGIGAAGKFLFADFNATTQQLIGVSLIRYGVVAYKGTTQLLEAGAANSGITASNKITAIYGVDDSAASSDGNLKVVVPHQQAPPTLEMFLGKILSEIAGLKTTVDSRMSSLEKQIAALDAKMTKLEQKHLQ